MVCHQQVLSHPAHTLQHTGFRLIYVVKLGVGMPTDNGFMLISQARPKSIWFTNTNHVPWISFNGIVAQMDISPAGI